MEVGCRALTGGQITLHPPTATSLVLSLFVDYIFHDYQLCSVFPPWFSTATTGVSRRTEIVSVFFRCLLTCSEKPLWSYRNAGIRRVSGRCSVTVGFPCAVFLLSMADLGTGMHWSPSYRTKCRQTSATIS